MTKDEIRKEKLAARHEISDFDRDILSNSVCFEFMVRTDLRKFDNIMIYKSYNGEVNTDNLIEILFSMGKHLSVPYIDENNEMHAAMIDQNTEFVLDKYKIRTPKTFIEAKSVELCLLPLAAFDADCNRLGYGKGYYDKFLATHFCTKIGLAFDVQKCDKLPVETHDIRLDGVITPTKIYCKKD